MRRHIRNNKHRKRDQTVGSLDPSVETDLVQLKRDNHDMSCLRQDGEGTHKLQNPQLSNINREGRINANIDIGASYSRKKQSRCRRVVTIVHEWGLRFKIRDFRRYSEVSGCQADCGCLCKLAKQKILEVLLFDGRLLGVKEGRTRLVVCVPERSSQSSSCGKMCKSASPRRLHEKIKTVSPIRRFLSRKVQGEKGEEIFFEQARLRGLSDDAINSSVQGWLTAWRRHRQRIGQFIDYWKGIGVSLQDLISHKDPETEIINYVIYLMQNKASANNIVESEAALTLLFKVSGRKNLQNQGKMLQLIMIKFRAALKKTQKEESINNFDDLLQMLDKQARNIGQISEKSMIKCTIVSTVIFSVLRLAEVLISEAIKCDNGIWQLSLHHLFGQQRGLIAIKREQKQRIFGIS
ncbi:MAG: hypothetical protein EZS28_002817 [Streblomastix strix]|uniref:Tyr recombinase domain-containing protein n=1 Tax=Streblomastix strix TaxID=222440 RepID=A0A5J4X2X8_9EUKA|nr:MAG: hypothetical protein EZS28_002814 [Streblomastix strix]KAA6401660.1 MAG: hypothetical protein EZS28_002817 [Streblomastix strix]